MGSAIKKVAKVALPIVGSVVGGPLGGMVGGMVGKAIGGTAKKVAPAASNLAAATGITPAKVDGFQQDKTAFAPSAESNQLATQQKNALAEAQNRQAPQVAQQTAMATERADAAQSQPLNDVQAQTTNLDQLTTRLNAMGGGVKAAQAAQAGNAAQLSGNYGINTSAGSFGGASVGEAERIKGAQLNTTNADEIRAKQIAFMDQLQSEANGIPSNAAQLANKQVQDRNIAQQMAIANSGRGNPAALARTAANNVGRTNQEAGQNMLSQIEQERTNARGILNSAQQGARDLDVNIAGQNANLDQSTQTFNADQANQNSRLGAQLANAAGIASAGNSAQLTIADAQNRLNADQFNAGAQNDFSKLNAQFAQQTGLQNNQNDANFARDNAGYINQTNLANQNALNQNNQFNQSNTLQNQQFNAGLQNSNNQFNANQGNQNNQFNQNLNQNVNLANAQNQLTSQGQQDALTQFYNSQLQNQNQFNSTSAQNQQAQALNAFNAQNQLQNQNNTNSQNKVGGLISGIGSALGSKTGQKVTGALGGLIKTGVSKVGGAVLGGLFSDERLKESIEAGDADINDMFDQMQAVSYTYKANKEKAHGILAQDLLKSKAGRTLVLDTPHGLMVDSPKAVGTLLASSAEMHKRIKQLEKLVSNRKGAR